MRFGSLFSGCGGMDGGLEAAGMSCAWQVEIDRACLSVLRHHWPEVPKHEDITKIQEGDLAPVDLIAGGSPCQDLSVAGRGEGLAGERSGLFHQFVRIADSQPAAWILWENVPGTLSSNGGADFGIVLRELSGFWPAMPAGGWRGSGFCVGQKRALAWRVLDSQYFGVAQQRERVFIVGCPRGGGSPAEVLFEPESLPGHPPEGGEARARVAGLLAGGSGGRGWRVGADEAAGGQLVAAIQDASGPTEKGQGSMGIRIGEPMYTLHGYQHGVCAGVAHTVNARGGNRLDFESETLVAYRKAQKAHGPDDCERWEESDTAPALDAGGHSARTATAIPTRAGVRRLTPRECERLQGFPDDWTRWADDGRELKDSPRYRMIGNAVTWPVAKWIGRRALAVLEKLINPAESPEPPATEPPGAAGSPAGTTRG